MAFREAKADLFSATVRWRHNRALSHAPIGEPGVIPNIIQQSISNSGQSFFSWYGQTQGLLVRLSNLITKRSD